jgi:phage terminase large subunit-like protein
LAKLSRKEQIRETAEADLEKFINLIHPNRVLGSIHSKIIKWWDRDDAKSHKLDLMHRDHQKSALVGYRVAHRITRDPSVRILYLSSTSTLAIKQLKFIKDILLNPTYQEYWPEMLHPDEAKREKWTETEISVDHPKRKAEHVRDATIFTGGLTTTVTGLHADVTVFDDVVVQENAYTEEGREKVRAQYSLLASIEGTNAQGWVVGTRYHPQDLYNDLTSMSVTLYGPDGEPIGDEPVYEILQEQVESKGDGSGEFLWPLQFRGDGKPFGFNQKILAKKFAQYLDKAQFYSQYYNDPNRSNEDAIPRDSFQYYDRKFLQREAGGWYIKGKRLTLMAAMDFAYTRNKKSDYSVIVIVGVTSDGFYYIIDIDRFQAELPSEYFKHLLDLHMKWDFKKVVCEVTAAQKVIVNDLKQSYILPHGLPLSVLEFTPSRQMGAKEERIFAVLQPKYANRQIWHYLGGNCQVLEDELTKGRPPHDDVKDALATCVQHIVVPAFHRPSQSNTPVENYTRFGGF